MRLVLASFGLDSWGLVAAIILVLSLIFSTILSLVLTGALMLGLAWVREKAELLSLLRPFVDDLNRASDASKHGEPLPQEVADNKMLQVGAQISKMTGDWSATATNIEQKVEHGSERVANAVIEFRARTAMVKGIAKAFFVPGATTRSRRTMHVEQVSELEREQAASEPEAVSEPPVYEEEMTIVQSSR
jgi:hypothetical protein